MSSAKALLDAIDGYTTEYSRDTKYRDSLARLTELRGEIEKAVPAEPQSPGRRAARAVAEAAAARAPSKPTPSAPESPPAAEQPRSFADASEAARERLSAPA